MTATIAVSAFLLAVLALRIALEMRLKNHHREIHRQLVGHTREGNLFVAHINNKHLRRFLLRREYTALGDAHLSMLCNAMLALIIGFLLLMLGALFGVIQLVLSQGAGQA